jgi:hypothetical protein
MTTRESNVNNNEMIPNQLLLDTLRELDYPEEGRVNITKLFRLLANNPEADMGVTAILQALVEGIDVDPEQIESLKQGIMTLTEKDQQYRN